MEPRHGANQTGHVQGYETTDTSVHSVALLAGAFVGLLIFGLIVGYGTFRLLTAPESVSGPPALIETSRTLPPGPRLQVDARKDLAGYLKDQQQTLDSYGWVDQKAGVVRVPIDRAMDLLLEKGLPVRAESAGGAPASRPKAATGAIKQVPPAAGAGPGNPNPGDASGGGNE